MKSKVTELVQQFIQTIGKDIALYQKLLPLLKSQKEIYLTFDAGQLTKNIDQQKPLLEQLNSNSVLRTDIMKQLGLPANNQGAIKLLNVLPGDLSVKAKQLWQVLNSLVMQCQEYNHDNGASCASFHELISQIQAPEQHTYSEHL